MTVQAAGSNNDPPAIFAPTGLEFQITDNFTYRLLLCEKKMTKNFQNNQNQDLRGLLSGINTQMTFPSNNNNLSYLIDPTFTKFNRLFALSFERIEENNVKKDHKDSFSRYHVPNVEIKYFNVLNDGKSFFDFQIKNEKEPYEKNIEMSRKNDYTNANLLNFPYFKENYRLIAIDLSKQIKLKNPQQINFTGELESQANEATVFFHHRKIRRN